MTRAFKNPAPLPLLEVRHLCKFFGRQLGCHDINFEICPGEVIGVVGESGSGKSTLLNCIAGRVKPSNGSVLFNSSVGVIDLCRCEEALMRRIIRTQTGYVTQNPARSLTISEKMRMLDTEARYLQEIAGQYPDILIALENARPYLSQSPYTYAECIGPLKEQILRVNKDNVKINLDFGHLFMASRFYQFDPVEEVKPIKDLVVHNHVHDNFGGVVHHWEKQQTHQLPFGRGDSHMPVGCGQIPIQAILDILLPGYDGLLIMELRSRYFSDMKTSLNNLSALVAACKARQ